MPKGLRDLIAPLPDTPTLHDIVAANPPVDECRSDVEKRIGTRMPGDDLTGHPLALQNPYKGANPQKLRRMLAEGVIKDTFLRQQALEWLRAYEILTGEIVIKSCADR